MTELNKLLGEIGISKVKLAKFLGVSRQMIYNYLELEDINKWPKDKKVLLLNLLGVKTPEDIPNIELYMDQVTTFMDSQLSGCKRTPEDKILTNPSVPRYL